MYNTCFIFCRKFHWTYVSVVYSDTDYGNKGYEKLQEFAPPEICFSSPQSINVDHFSESDYDTVITNLMHKTHARGMLIVASLTFFRLNNIRYNLPVLYLFSHTAPFFAIFTEKVFTEF